MIFREVVTDDFRTFDMRLLDEANLDELQMLCNNCTDYYLLDKGSAAESNEAQNILKAIPEGKHHSDLFNVGVFSESSRLVALIHIVRNFPKENVWMLGLLLIDPKERNNKLGTLIHKELVKTVSDHEGEVIRIGVLENNTRALKFWGSLGYKFEKETEIIRDDNRVSNIKVFNYKL